MDETRNNEADSPSLDEEWVTQQQAADLLGIHRQTVLSLAAEGELETKKVARWVVISRASIERYLAKQAA